jgi:hypothetical protein
MAETREQLRIWRRRAWRRRWLYLGVSWAVCAPGWAAVGLLSPDRPAVFAGFLALALLVGAAAGVAIAAVAGGRAQVFDSATELRRYGLPVLGEVADLSRGPWRRACAKLAWALASLSLLAALAGLLVVRTSGLLTVR